MIHHFFKSIHITCLANSKFSVAPSIWSNRLSNYSDAHTFVLIATVHKIITEILANDPGMTFTREARDVLIECCVEFLTLISSEANEIAEREAKKTIATEHIEKALRELGFPEYVEEVVSVAEDHKEQLKVILYKTWHTNAS